MHLSDGSLRAGLGVAFKFLQFLIGYLMFFPPLTKRLRCDKLWGRCHPDRSISPLIRRCPYYYASSLYQSKVAVPVHNSCMNVDYVVAFLSRSSYLRARCAAGFFLFLFYFTTTPNLLTTNNTTTTTQFY